MPGLIHFLSDRRGTSIVKPRPYWQTGNYSRHRFRRL